MKQETLEQEPCNYCGKTLREQMKGCNEITCYRQFLSKQETIEKTAFESSIDYKPFKGNLSPKQYYEQGFIDGAKWQAEKMYEIMDNYVDDVMGGCNLRAKDWFEQFKNK